MPRLWTKFQLGVRAKLSERKEAVLFRVPFVGRRIKKKILAQLGLADVRLALTGAAPLPPEILTWYRELGLELLEGYGMSENMAYSHLTKLGEGARVRRSLRTTAWNARSARVGKSW